MNKTLSNIIICITALLIVGTASRYFYSNYSQIFFAEPAVEVAPAAVPAHTITGSFLMTLKPTIPVTALAGVYTVPAKGGAPTLQSGSGTSTNYYLPSLSTDGRVAVVSPNSETSSQLFISKISDPSNAYPVAPPYPAVYAGASHWSPDNRYIVYEAVTALPNENDVDITNSRVVLLDTVKQEQKIIDVGTSPVFYKDGSILYIKPEGIYRITHEGLTLASSTETLLHFVGYKASRNSRIAVSQSGDQLVVTYPNEAKLLVYHIADPKMISLDKVQSVDARAFYPIFSPDGTSIAFIDIAKDADGRMTKALSVMNVQTTKKQTVFDLTAYSDVYLSLGAWLQ